MTQHIHIRPRRRFFVLLLTLLLTSSLQALPILNGGGGGGARPGGLLDPPRGPVRQRLENTLGIDEAIAIAERRYNGKAVGARAMGNGVYRVRILQDDGKVRTVTISR